ncbi:hypothetical protein BV22DRAFT_1132613 [Leucogyrophana mollusca]|uniref:Uncharacterized protein n=1 Tax=Leucogyrophana mollusca TaxID=85980 RepID=A0ACB8B6F0_9AGAM|nr:hypothetical protein BV22DRAFT_1132613 [Leucogyrophana mollusca]
MAYPPAEQAPDPSADSESSDEEDTGPFDASHVSIDFLYENYDNENGQLDDDIDPPPIQLQNTRNLRDALEQVHDIAERVENILQYMNQLGFNLPLFLFYVCWGHHGCTTNPKIRYEHTALMVSEELPIILVNCHKPPRTSGSHHVRAAGARRPLELFAFSCVADVVNAELDGIKSLTRCPDEQVSGDGFTSLYIEDMLLKLSSPGFGGTPKLWALLGRLTKTSAQEKRNTEKNTDLVNLSIIFQIAFSRNQYDNRWAKFLTTFLRAQGISAKSLDLLRRFCITMSHKWSVRSVATISSNEMARVRDQVQRLPFVISHDNLNIPFRVFSQRLDNQSHFDCGTAATVFFQPNAPTEVPLDNRAFQEYQAEGRKVPISITQIYDLEQAAAPHHHARDIYRVLQYLLQSPNFDFSAYSDPNHPAFTPPPPVKKLPSGPDYVTQQFMLGTVQIDEASYEGNDKLIGEILQQINLHSEEEKKKTRLKRVIVWAGDQLTVERLRGLFKFRAQDHNSYDRLDWMLPVFGWFHSQMAFANSLHKQYLGTNAGRGLMQAFSLLERKGLHTVQTRGPFHQNLHDAILHVAEAHFHACWKVVGGVEKLEELRNRDPTELLEMSRLIVKSLASSEAIEAIDQQPDDTRDHVFRHAALFLRDVLRYVDLNEAIKCGDIGVMEQTLPHLLFRFAGGNNSKYTIEVLELLQGLQHEWTPQVKDFVLRRGWLINSTGRENDYLPIDKGQEHNIKDIKVTHRTQGPNASWDLMKKISPVIPTFRAVRKHMESQIKTLRRGTSHTDPSKERDVDRLEDAYTASHVHVQTNGRQFKSKADEVVDVVSNGALYLLTKKTLKKWWNNRDFKRSMKEDW